MQHMGRLGDLEIGNRSSVADIMILAGDFNVSPNEDHCLVNSDWRDAWLEGRKIDISGRGSTVQWTWKKGGFSSRYDRVYTKNIGRVSVTCSRATRVTSV